MIVTTVMLVKGSMSRAAETEANAAEGVWEPGGVSPGGRKAGRQTGTGTAGQLGRRHVPASRSVDPPFGRLLVFGVFFGAFMYQRCWRPRCRRVTTRHEYRDRPCEYVDTADEYAVRRTAIRAIRYSHVWRHMA